ncbi:MAG: hypothetical protein RR444_11710, partial [Oscillospiraceae bacterium]
YHQTGQLLADLGLGYIYVAHKEAFLFKAIYMENIADIKLSEFPKNPMITKTLELTENINNVDDTATKAWIFAHGIASLVATKMILSFGEDLKK